MCQKQVAKRAYVLSFHPTLTMMHYLHRAVTCLLIWEENNGENRPPRQKLVFLVWPVILSMGSEA